MKLNIDQTLQQAVIAHKEGQTQKAESLYRTILQSEPLHPDTNHNLGVLAVSVDKANYALPLFKTALEANPKSEQFWLSYIGALKTLGLTDDVKAAFANAKSANVGQGALAQLEQELTKQTLKIYETIAKKTRESSIAAQEPSEEQVQYILDLYNQGQLQKALSDTSQILEDIPNSTTLLNISGACNDSLMKFDASINNYLDALSVSPDNAETYYNLAHTLRNKGDVKTAIDCYKQSLKIKPDSANAYNSIGYCFSEMGNPKAAIGSFKQALLIKPGFTEVHYNLGLALFSVGDLSGSVESYNEALLLEPNHVGALNNMGIALHGQGKIEEAIESYNKAILNNPDAASTHYNLGNALNDMCEIDSSIASFKKALEIKPNYAAAAFNLSGLTTSISESKSWVENCLQHDPLKPEAKLLLAALKFYEGDKSNFNELRDSQLKGHPFMRSLEWIFSLPNLPELHFNKFYFFDAIVKKSITSKPFYEFGVFRASSFKYLIKFFKKGYGFDTFTGLPEDWNVGSHIEKKGTYSGDRNVPSIKGGEFIIGKFEDTLPGFFSESRPMASVINFDADLYSSTICALNFSKPVMDKDTILIFDELIINESWEQDEFKALNEFCSINHFSYEVIAISFFTKQVAVKLIGL